jgi:hypothetical protein
MQSHQHKQMDARALGWLDGELEHPERFRVERFDGRAWTLLE